MTRFSTFSVAFINPQINAEQIFLEQLDRMKLKERPHPKVTFMD